MQHTTAKTRVGRKIRESLHNSLTKRKKGKNRSLHGFYFSMGEGADLQLQKLHLKRNVSYEQGLSKKQNTNKVIAFDRMHAFHGLFHVCRILMQSKHTWQVNRENEEMNMWQCELNAGQSLLHSLFKSLLCCVVSPLLLQWRKRCQGVLGCTN